MLGWIPFFCLMQPIPPVRSGPSAQPRRQSKARPLSYVPGHLRGRDAAARRAYRSSLDPAGSFERPHYRETLLALGARPPGSVGEERAIRLAQLLPVVLRQQADSYGMQAFVDRFMFILLVSCFKSRPCMKARLRPYRRRRQIKRRQFLRDWVRHLLSQLQNTLWPAISRSRGKMAGAARNCSSR